MLTPRQYLSWSSMDLFERDVERWKQVYLYGEKTPVNRGMAFGRTMAEGLEKDELTGDMTLDLAMERLPKFEIMDQLIECKLKNGKEIIPIVIKPDTINKEMTAFKEYKTGQTAWTKKKVDDCGQITFYATGIFLKTGKIPYDIELVHVLTEKVNQNEPDANLRATGDIIRHPTTRSMSQILNMMIRMKKVWEGIIKISSEELL